jgi:hypothetical protein
MHECNFWTQSVISRGTSAIYICRVRFLHAECDFYTQSVISTLSVILKLSNVTTTLTTVISTRTRVISTRRVWCWHVWVVILTLTKVVMTLIRVKTTACRNHSCVWCSHAYCDEHTHECNFWTQSVISTRTSVIYICRVRFPHEKCDFYTKSVISTRSVMLKRTNVISSRTRVFLYFSTRRVWFWHVWL